ncbi:MAG: peptide chain release factor-like protein [Phycisphaerales bacterium]
MARPRDQDPEAEWLAKLDASIGRVGTPWPRPAPPEPLIVSGPHPARLAPDELLRHCDLSRGRSSGPGGQHRNKVETLVHLTHEPTGVQAQAGERRSAAENKREAVWRLRLALAVQVRCAVGAGDVRSGLWIRRTAGEARAGRITVSPTHDDYPAMLAEALDMLWACGLDVATAAARLECTSSQLVKLVKDHPAAMVWVNARRTAMGMRALR